MTDTFPVNKVTPETFLTSAATLHGNKKQKPLLKESRTAKGQATSPMGKITCPLCGSYHTIPYQIRRQPYLVVHLLPESIFSLPLKIPYYKENLSEFCVTCYHTYVLIASPKLRNLTPRKATAKIPLNLLKY